MPWVRARAPKSRRLPDRHLFPAGMQCGKGVLRLAGLRVQGQRRGVGVPLPPVRLRGPRRSGALRGHPRFDFHVLEPAHPPREASRLPVCHPAFSSWVQWRPGAAHSPSQGCAGCCRKPGAHWNPVVAERRADGGFQGPVACSFESDTGVSAACGPESRYGAFGEGTSAHDT